MVERSPNCVVEPSADGGVLLLVTSEAGPCYTDLVDRLRKRGDTRCISLGSGASATVAEVAVAAPSHVVTVPFSFGGTAPSPADVTGLVRWARTRWPNMIFIQGQPAASREHIIGWASRQIQASCDGWSDHEPSDTAVLVVSEGATPDGTAEVCALARLLSEHHQYEIVEVAFLRDARSTIAVGIDRCHRLGARRIILLPLSLLDGPFHQQARAQTERLYARGLPQHVRIAAPLLTPTAAAAVMPRRYTEALARWLDCQDDGCARGHSHEFTSQSGCAREDVLPPRYRAGQVVSGASMRSAPLAYDEEGRVAWDRVWRSFCDLALAGGPPHRGTLLEPPSRDEVLARPSDSARVVAEIGRGLSMVTRLPVVTDSAPGWVGLACTDEEMAVWLLRAIVVENVSVRREGATLFLPAGPNYTIEKEIKNVITAVAKTHHYWTEHRTGR
jgi:sirohydrochlorin cobaltochelatase